MYLPNLVLSLFFFAVSCSYYSRWRGTSETRQGFFRNLFQRRSTKPIAIFLCPPLVVSFAPRISSYAMFAKIKGDLDLEPQTRFFFLFFPSFSTSTTQRNDRKIETVFWNGSEGNASERRCAINPKPGDKINAFEADRPRQINYCGWWRELIAREKRSTLRTVPVIISMFLAWPCP